MPVTIESPRPSVAFTDGAPKIDCSANTIGGALNELTHRFPAIARTSATIRPDSPIPQRLSQ